MTPKLAVYAAHDTTLSGFLNAIDCFNSRWPPFTSHISVELFKAPSSSFLRLFASPQHYVRVRFNGEALKLPACAPEGKHRGDASICTFEAFRDAVSDIVVDEVAWRTACAT